MNVSEQLLQALQHHTLIWDSQTLQAPNPTTFRLSTRHPITILLKEGIRLAPFNAYVQEKTGKTLTEWEEEEVCYVFEWGEAMLCETCGNVMPFDTEGMGEFWNGPEGFCCHECVRTKPAVRRLYFEELTNNVHEFEELFTQQELERLGWKRYPKGFVSVYGREETSTTAKLQELAKKGYRNVIFKFIRPYGNDGVQLDIYYN